jgi:hypothetical protein
MTTEEFELSRIEFEMARNKAMDDYFNARSDYERTTSSERIFEGGFRMAWEIWMNRT